MDEREYCKFRALLTAICLAGNKVAGDSLSVDKAASLADEILDDCGFVHPDCVVG